MSHRTYGEYRRANGGGGGVEPERPVKRRRIAPPRDEEPLDGPRGGVVEDAHGFQPSMLTFKAFLGTQDDSITDDEALTKFAEYKLEFHRQQLDEFFGVHRDEEWFKEKYHPDFVQERRNRTIETFKKRVNVFLELYLHGKLKEIRLEEDKAKVIEIYLDCLVARLEGGTDELVSQLLNEEAVEKELHKTTSIHLRQLHPCVLREEVEAVCSKFPGYLRTCLADPQPEKRWFRKAWVSFVRNAKIKDICVSLGSVRFKDVEVSPVLNKDLSRRIRSVSGIANDKKVMRADIKAATNLIKMLDNKWKLWENTTDNIVGEQSSNPVLENITEYLIEEMSAEEDELLGYNSQDSSSKTTELDENLCKVLDRLVLYLRLVHSVDYYNASHYVTEDEMPNRCGIFHVRETFASQQTSDDELNYYIEGLNKRLQPLYSSTTELTAEEAAKLGTKDETEAVEIFVQANTEELGNEKFLCTLSGKKFKGSDFVRKHIFNKHTEKVENVKKDVQYFNNYIKDPRRPKLPEKPKPAHKPKPLSPQKPVLKPAQARFEPPQDERPRGSVKDRLGYKPSAMKVTHARSDPRGMVDYSDVDFNDDIF